MVYHTGYENTRWGLYLYRELPMRYSINKEREMVNNVTLLYHM